MSLAVQSGAIAGLDNNSLLQICTSKVSMPRRFIKNFARAVWDVVNFKTFAIFKSSKMWSRPNHFGFRWTQ